MENQGNPYIKCHVCIMYLLWAWLGQVDGTVQTGSIHTHRQEVVLVAITICRKQKQRELKLQSWNVGWKQLEPWSFVFYSGTILIFPFHQNASDLFWRQLKAQRSFWQQKKMVPCFFFPPHVSRITGTPACFLRANIHPSSTFLFDAF